MTLPVPISLKCPCCKTKFEGLDVMISSTFGSSTDLRQISGGSDPMYMIIHTCPSCGYTGYDDAFKRKRIDPTLKERISKEITPLMKDFSVRPEWPYEYAAPERQYEFAAWIAEWKRGSVQSIGDLYLRSAWCCNDFNKPRKERFYRLKALEFFEKAMELKEISARDAGLYTYLIGELHRRVGEIGAASVWFDRVAEATKGDPKQRWLEGLAFQQKTDPKELIGPGKLLPPPPNGYKWCARCFKKVKIQHLLEGYGPGCWSKITHGSEFIDWLEQPTITDRGLAERSMLKIWESLGDIQLCRCKSDALLASYDYDYGFELLGFKYRQRVFLHCPKCDYDRVLHKIPNFKEIVMKNGDSGK